MHVGRAGAAVQIFGVAGPLEIIPHDQGAIHIELGFRRIFPLPDEKKIEQPVQCRREIKSRWIFSHRRLVNSERKQTEEVVPLSPAIPTTVGTQGDQGVVNFWKILQPRNLLVLEPGRIAIFIRSGPAIVPGIMIDCLRVSSHRSEHVLGRQRGTEKIRIAVFKRGLKQLLGIGWAS